MTGFLRRAKTSKAGLAPILGYPNTNTTRHYTKLSKTQIAGEMLKTGAVAIVKDLPNQPSTIE